MPGHVHGSMHVRSGCSKAWESDDQHRPVHFLPCTFYLRPFLGSRKAAARCGNHAMHEHQAQASRVTAGRWQLILECSSLAGKVREEKHSARSAARKRFLCRVRLGKQPCRCCVATTCTSISDLQKKEWIDIVSDNKHTRIRGDTLRTSRSALWRWCSERVTAHEQS